MGAHWTEGRVVLGNRGRLRCGPGWRLDEQWSDRLNDYDFWLVWEGRGTMKTASGVLRLEPGVCVWMRPGGRYVAEQDPAARLGVTYAHFTVEREGGGPWYGWEVPAEVTLFGDVGYADAVARRAVEHATPEVGAALMRGLLMDLESRHAPRGGQAAPTDERRAVAELAARIREDPASAQSVAEMAERVGWSTDHFTRVFREMVGRSPREFVVAARMERARVLLRETGMSVKQVAKQVGYAELFYFSRHFKMRTGVTPREWRRG